MYDTCGTAENHIAYHKHCNRMLGPFLHEWLNWFMQRGSKEVEEEMAETRLELATH